MQVQSLGWEDLLEEEMATHSSVLAWEIPWTEELVGYSPRGSKEPDTTELMQAQAWHSPVLVIFCPRKSLSALVPGCQQTLTRSGYLCVDKRQWKSG